MSQNSKRYRLGSSPLVYAPGIIAWAINGYHFKRYRKKLRAVITETWKGVSDEAAHRLLSGNVKYTIEGEAVVFETEASPAGSANEHDKEGLRGHRSGLQEAEGFP